MNTPNDEIMLKELVEDYLAIMEEGNEEKFKKLWHPKAIRFGLGNDKELNAFDLDDMIKFSLNGLKNLRKQLPDPSIVQFKIDDIIELKCIEGCIASVEMKWHMLLPGSKGIHHTFIQFAKDKNIWYIVNILDKGFEIVEE
ncbi:MAG: nuclear transport factor 2 family protein [Candidatus Heimdallarchaeota archaeon]